MYLLIVFVIVNLESSDLVSVKIYCKNGDQ